MSIDTTRLAVGFFGLALVVSPMAVRAQATASSSIAGTTTADRQISVTTTADRQIDSAAVDRTRVVYPVRFTTRFMLDRDVSTATPSSRSSSSIRLIESSK